MKKYSRYGGITSSQEQSTRGDLIQTCKTKNGLESSDCYSGLRFVSDWRTREATSARRALKLEAFPSTAFDNFCRFVNDRHEFSALQAQQRQQQSNFLN